MSAKPFLKWCGGKRQLLSELRSHYRGGHYHEPFIGGGALFFCLMDTMMRPRTARLSDMNERLVRTYRAVRDDVERVIALLATYPYEKSFFDGMRKMKIDQADDASLAAWFIYLNRTGFNGLYRVNKKGEFNVPFGKYDNPLICDAENLRTCSRTLRDVEIERSDFSAVNVHSRPGDFIYFDPPYVPLSATSDFTGYTAEGFTDSDQVRLRDLALLLRSAGRTVVLSNSSAPRVKELYREFTCEEVGARRNLNSKGDRRGEVKELLIY
jgi:DNA adenine methylase